METKKYLNIYTSQRTLDILYKTGEVYSHRVNHNLVEMFLLMGSIWYEVTYDINKSHDEYICLVPVLNSTHCVDGYDMRTYSTLRRLRTFWQL